ncbi:MAG: DUF1343 domain-containing protein [Verrucomicrobiota bacterium]
MKPHTMRGLGRFVTGFVALVLLGAAVDSARAAEPKVKLGIDTLAGAGFKGLEGKKVGLITNPSGVNAAGRSTLDVLFTAPEVDLVALFAPEHGIYGERPAGEKIAKRTDERTGLPVFSLYGETKKPTPEMLEGIDVLMYDLQDIGCRSYTYISTLGLAMEAAGEAGVDFFVLDRPNPLGGDRVEGPPIGEAYLSFVGQWKIPYVYGMTAGELARMIKGENWLKTNPKLVIVPMQGWKRAMLWPETGLAWVPTSPNIPTYQAAVLYSVTGLLGEGLKVNHGIGSRLPFEYLGGREFNAFSLAEKLNGGLADGGFKGVSFRPAFWEPLAGDEAGQVVQGVQIMLRDPVGLDLCALSLYLMSQLVDGQGKELFKPAALEDKSLFVKVCGGPEILEHLTLKKPWKELTAKWNNYHKVFRLLRKDYLLKNYD